MWVNQQELAGRMQITPELMANLPPTPDAMGMPMILFNELAHQAAEIAYVNDFQLLMWISLAAMPLVLFLSKPVAPPAQAGQA
jgi:DHA2 family multidrug resistance protein